jgi:hypothetical protein
MIVTLSFGDRRLLDAEADVPAEWILQQSGPSDATAAGFIVDRQGACPSEPYSSDQEDRDLAPATIHTDDP